MKFSHLCLSLDYVLTTDIEHYSLRDVRLQFVIFVSCNSFVPPAKCTVETDQKSRKQSSSGLGAASDTG